LFGKQLFCIILFCIFVRLNVQKVSRSPYPYVLYVKDYSAWQCTVQWKDYKWHQSLGQTLVKNFFEISTNVTLDFRLTFTYKCRIWIFIMQTERLSVTANL